MNLRIIGETAANKTGLQINIDQVRGHSVGHRNGEYLRLVDKSYLIEASILVQTFNFSKWGRKAFSNDTMVLTIAIWISGHCDSPDR